MIGFNWFSNTSFRKALPIFRKHLIYQMQRVQRILYHLFYLDFGHQ